MTFCYVSKGRDKEGLSVTGLIRERDEVDRQVQDVRQQHREKSDFKLQQILQSKQKVIYCKCTEK